MKEILVLNPNSTVEVTEGIAEVVAPLAGPGVRFVCEDLSDGPATIASAADVARAGLGFAARVRERPADAYVSACFSDPGVEIVRGIAPGTPVIGIQEASLLTAMARADRFGIIALSPGVVERHRQRIRAMGIESRLAGELALPGVSALASGRDPEVFAQCVGLGRQLRDMGAGAVVLGCAGMAPIRARLEAETGLVVIDPVMAGAVMALGAVV